MLPVPPDLYLLPALTNLLRNPPTYSERALDRIGWKEGLASLLALALCP